MFHDLFQLCLVFGIVATEALGGIVTAKIPHDDPDLLQDHIQKEDEDYYVSCSFFMYVRKFICP